MDLSQPVSFGSVDLNTVTETAGVLSGCTISACDYSALDVRQFTEPMSRQDGIDVGGVWLGGRHITMAGTLYGATRAALASAITALQDAMTPTAGTYGVSDLDFFTLGDTGLTRKLLSARPNGVHIVYRGDAHGGNDSLPLAVSWSASFLAFGGATIPDFPCGITDAFSRVLPTTWGQAYFGGQWEEDTGASSPDQTYWVADGAGTLRSEGHFLSAAAMRMTGLPINYFANPAGVTTTFRVKFDQVGLVGDNNSYCFAVGPWSSGTHRPSVLFRVSANPAWGWVQAQDVSGVIFNKQTAYGVAKTDWVADTWYNVEWFWQYPGDQKIKIYTDLEGDPGWLATHSTAYASSGLATKFFVSNGLSGSHIPDMPMEATIDDLDIQDLNLCT